LVPAGVSAAVPETTTVGSNYCGSNSQEALTQAEKALAGKNADAQARAISCLIAAVKALDSARLDAVRDKEKTRMLRVPRNP
jgi:hypothetical protein